MIKTAANTAHELANKADEYEELHDWSNAIIAHDKAALQFENATSDAKDLQTKDTLQLLAKNHTKKSQELQRKVQRMAANAFDMRKLEKEIKAIQTGEIASLPSSIHDSYTMLNTEEEDSEDPFNKFWSVVKPMMNKISNPVAFASTPLHENDQPILKQSSKVYEEVVGEEELSRIEREMSSISESFFVNPASKSTKDEEEDDTYTPNSSSYHSMDSNRDYKRENEELRAQIQELNSRVQDLEKKTIDSTVLKSSIAQFKNDVHKQALRILQTQDSTMMTRSATTTGSPLSKNIRTVGTSTAEIVNRIKELEDANRSLRSQNRKQDALMNKYRERWEKLKEGAKKRHTSTKPSNPTLLRSLASNNPPLLPPQ